jgi:UDP-N-acetylmuramoyl-tripeptide--D-alanyl-D-alanine ligase
MAVGKPGTWSKSKRRTLILALLAVLAAVAAGLGWRFGEGVYVRVLLESPSSGRCQHELTRAVLERSLALGTKFLLAHQKPEGNFDYEYDWREQTLTNDDNETRQAGALWGVSMLYQTSKTPELAAAVERGLAFFDQHSRATGKVRCTVYPGSSVGHSGTIALVALAYIEYLRAAPELTAEQRRNHEQRLDEYLEMLLASVNPDGVWFGDYDIKNCKPRGEHSSYSDGEALLALAKAAKYLGRRQYVGPVMLSAAAGRRINIQEARAADPDSDVTKGYYQWSSMAFYEIATSDFPHAEDYPAAVLDLADWVIDEHHILTRNRNTGYAYEGIIHAFALAQQRKDAARTAKYGCVIDIGMQRLVGWQVGGPTPTRFTSTSTTDAKAIGGVQNTAYDAPLRIDVTQHQMHATQLALEYVYK